MDLKKLKVMAEGSKNADFPESAPSTIRIKNGAGRSAQNPGCNPEHSSKGTVPSENSRSQW